MSISQRRKVAEKDRGPNRASPISSSVNSLNLKSMRVICCYCAKIRIPNGPTCCSEKKELISQNHLAKSNEETVDNEKE